MTGSNKAYFKSFNDFKEAVEWSNKQTTNLILEIKHYANTTNNIQN